MADELEQEGVPATSIVTVGRGEENLLVPTADGVREPRNRRVEIVVQDPPAPTPVAAAPAPTPVAEPEPVEEPAQRSVLTLGPIYGHNFGENNDGGENDLVGGELVYNAFPGFLGGASLKQAVLYSFNGNNDGINGRSAVSLDFAPDLGVIRPFLSGNFGGVYGGGFQDGIIFGPEVGFNLNLIEAVDMRAKVAYDFQARQLGWDEGILWTGLGIGVALLSKATRQWTGDAGLSGAPSSSLPAGIAAIGQHDAAGHEARSVGCQEQRHRADLVGLADPLHRRHLEPDARHARHPPCRTQ